MSLNLSGFQRLLNTKKLVLPFFLLISGCTTPQKNVVLFKKTKKGIVIHIKLSKSIF